MQWRVLLALASFAVLGTHEASATVLTFEGLPQDQGVPKEYGDRVIATQQDGFFYGAEGGFTPRVVVEYTGVLITVPPQIWATDYGDLVDVAFTTAARFDLTLRADSGFEVSLHSFDLGGWPQTDYTIDLVEIRDASDDVLFSESDVLVRGAGPDHTDVDFGTPLVSEALRIFIDASNLEADPGAGFSQNIGLDNIQFSQVPEPDVLFLRIAAVFTLLTMARRRTAAH